MRRTAATPARFLSNALTIADGHVGPNHELPTARLDGVKRVEKGSQLGRAEDDLVEFVEEEAWTESSSLDGIDFGFCHQRRYGSLDLLLAGQKIHGHVIDAAIPVEVLSYKGMCLDTPAPSGALFFVNAQSARSLSACANSLVE